MLAEEPRNAVLHRLQSMALFLQGDFEPAAKAIRRATKLEPKNVSYWNELAQIVFTSMNRPGAALKCYDEILKIDPKNGQAWHSRAMALNAMRENPEEIREGLDKAVDLLPKHYESRWQRMIFDAVCCHWGRRTEDEKWLQQSFDKHEFPGTSPLALNYFTTAPALHLRAGKLAAISVHERAKAQYGGSPWMPQKPRKPGRIRVGYLSADFRLHAVGYLVRDMFKHHNRDEFEVFCYSLTNQECNIRDRVKAGAEHFIDMDELPPQKQLTVMREAHLDVLVDMVGYTAFGKPEVLSARVAPVQLGWLGYLDTNGAGYYDGFIADRVCLPPDLAKHFIERIHYVDGSLFPCSPVNLLPGFPTRAEHGLPEKGFLFASFNSVYKYTPDLWDSWMRILKRVPESILWLYGGDYPLVADNLRRETEARGVDSGRLFFAKGIEYEEHLSRLRLADLVLDPFIYNGGTTNIGALQAGVPVVTLPGPNMLAKIGASILAGTGLGELVCKSVKEYEEMAVRVATDKSFCDGLRRKVDEKLAASEFFEIGDFVGKMERLYGGLVG